MAAASTQLQAREGEDRNLCVLLGKVETENRLLEERANSQSALLDTLQREVQDVRCRCGDAEEEGAYLTAIEEGAEGSEGGDAVPMSELSVGAVRVTPGVSVSPTEVGDPDDGSGVVGARYYETLARVSRPGIGWTGTSREEFEEEVAAGEHALEEEALEEEAIHRHASRTRYAMDDDLLSDGESTPSVGTTLELFNDLASQ
jgi:hypothetical protein